MAVKRVFIIVFLMMANIGISIANTPNLVGNWTGVFEGYHSGMDSNGVYINANQTGALSMAISEQKGRVFTGTFTENIGPNLTGIVGEGFSGAIGLDNKTLYFAEKEKGYDIGTIISNDAIELIYLEEGNGDTAGAFVVNFHRMK